MFEGAQSIWPDDVAPSAEDAAPPASSGQADTKPTRTIEPKSDATTTEKSEPAAKPAAAPKPEAVPTLSMTQAEFDAHVAEATKRARADQSAMAKQLKELGQRLEARERAFGDLVQQYRGTQVEGDALRTWMQSENATVDRIAQETQAAEEAQRNAAGLNAGKNATASALYQEQYGPLLYEAGQLGVSKDELVTLIDGVMQSETFAPFHRAYLRAQSVEDAAEVAKPGYVLMAQLVRAQLQQKKIDTLKEPESPPKPERTQAHGTGTSIPADPLNELPIGQRGRARLSQGLIADALRAYQPE